MNRIDQLIKLSFKERDLELKYKASDNKIIDHLKNKNIIYYPRENYFKHNSRVELADHADRNVNLKKLINEQRARRKRVNRNIINRDGGILAANKYLRNKENISKLNKLRNLLRLGIRKVK